MKDKHRDKDDREKEHQLASFLNHALLTYPSKFLNDFPLMVNALDSGESVNIDSISDPSFRAILNQIMRCLPLEHSYEFGFYRKENTKPIGGNILKQLLDAGCIRQPTELNSSERLASQHVPLVVLNLLASFPALKGDMMGLLTNLKSGNAVQLEDIENDGIREGLEKLFKGLELVYSSRSGSYELPEGRRGDLVEDAINHLLEVFKCETAYEKKVSKSSSSHSSDKKKHEKDRREEKGRSHKSGKHSDADSLAVDDSSSSSSDSDDKDDDNDNSESENSTVNNEIVIAGVASSLRSSDSLSDEKEGEVSSSGLMSASVPRVGPSMPSAAELSAAHRAYEEYLARGGGGEGSIGEDVEQHDSEEEEDEFGPQVYDPNKERLKSDRPLNSHLVKMQQVPLGFMETALESIEAQQSNVYQQRYVGPVVLVSN